MNFLLDTNTCIALINKRPTSVRERFTRELGAGSQMLVSSVSIFELVYGAEKSSHRAGNEHAMNALLSSVSDTIPFENEDARVAGRIRATLERSGTPIGPYDLLIAAQAHRRDLVVVTANEREFRRVIGLRWENWAE
ncbi:MAG TPA: type II toxin-antitoxin system VapC family toxin [Candidatus Binatia bacterium]|nr:type II toxin-antitoxin system VapC family toxin [Candidatus Binatia bacterium]